MKGKVVSKEERLYVEYVTEGAEQDEVQKKQMLITFTDQWRVEVGQAVDFEVQDYHTVDGLEIAKIK